MACFTGPLAAAAVTEIIRRNSSKNEAEKSVGIPFSQKLKWLRNLYLGGSALLAFEHVWHGELIFSFPFLTAAKSEVLYEIATVGSAMTVLVLAVWCGMLIVSAHLQKLDACEAVKVSIEP